VSVRRVSAVEAHDLMCRSGYLYLDVRSTQEFELGHPEGAFNIPWQHQADAGMRANHDFMRVVRRTFESHAPLIIGCRSGHRSLAAARRLLEAGFENVVEVQGGFAGARDPFGRPGVRGWQQEDLPTAVVAMPGRSYSELSGDGCSDRPPADD